MVRSRRGRRGRRNICRAGRSRKPGMAGRLLASTTRVLPGRGPLHSRRAAGHPAMQAWPRRPPGDVPPRILWHRSGWNCATTHRNRPGSQPDPPRCRTRGRSAPRRQARSRPCRPLSPGIPARLARGGIVRNSHGKPDLRLVRRYPRQRCRLSPIGILPGPRQPLLPPCRRRRVPCPWQRPKPKARAGPPRRGHRT